MCGHLQSIEDEARSLMKTAVAFARQHFEPIGDVEKFAALSAINQTLMNTVTLRGIPKAYKEMCERLFWEEWENGR